MPAIFVSHQVFSLSKLNMKIVYINHQDKEQIWNLNDGTDFNDQWFTNKKKVTFTVDLKGYYKNVENEQAEVPFSITGKFNNQNISSHITIKEKNEGKEETFKGLYDVTVSLEDALGKVDEKDGEVSLQLNIKNNNAWEIPVGNNPIKFNFIKDTSAPEITVKGIDQKVYTKDFPEMQINVEDKHLDEHDVQITILHNGKSRPVTEFLRGGTTDTYDFKDDGRYNVSVQAFDKAGNKKTLNVDEFFVHRNEVDVKIQANGQDITNTHQYFDQETTLDIVATNLLPIELAVLQVQKDNGSELKEYKADEIQNNVAKWKTEFKNDGNYKLSILVKDDHHEEGSGEHTLGITTLTIKTDKPNIITDGIENGQVFHTGGGIIPRTQKLDIEVEDELLKKVIIHVNGKEEVFEGRSKVSKRYSFKDNGEHTVLIEAIDKAGNKSTEELKFYIHKEEPVVHASINGNEKNISELFIQKLTDLDFVIDNSIPLNDVDITILKEGKELETVALNNINENTKKWSYSFEDEGKYTLQFTIIDDNDNGDSYIHELAPINVTVDNKQPNITVYENDGDPLLEDITRKKNVTVEVQEENFDPQLSEIVVLNEDDEPLDISFPKWKKKYGTSDVYVASYNFRNNGKYKLHVNIEDKAANKRTFKSNIFTIERNAPIVTVEGVEHEQHYNDNRPVDIKIKDNYLNIEETSVVLEKYNRTLGKYEPYEIEDELEFGKGNTARLSHEFIDEGTYQITVYAMDLAGNESAVKITQFTIDKTAPVLSIDHVKDGTYYAESKKVVFSIDEYEYATNEVDFVVTKNGKDITDTVENEVGSDWKTSGDKVQLAYEFKTDGHYEVHLMAIDKAGNKGNKQIKQFTIDQTNPNITITGVQDGTHYQNNKTVDISIEDVNINENKITVTKNGETYEMDHFEIDKDLDNRATLNHRFTEEGEYKMIVEAVDFANNKSTKTLSFVIDKTDPFIEVDHRYKNHMTANTIKAKGINELIKISLKETNLKEKEVTITHKDLSGKIETFSDDEVGKWNVLSNGKYHFELKEDFIKKDGIYEVTVSATDHSGRITKQDLPKLTVDNIAPEIQLANINRYNDGSVTEVIKITEHNYQKNNVTYEVFKLNNKGEFETYNRFDDWENTGKHTTLKLSFTEDGTYKVVVNATDNAGNKAEEKSNIFTIDTIKPVIIIDGIENTDKIIHYNQNKLVNVKIKDINMDEKRTHLEVKKLNRSTGKMEKYDTKETLSFTSTEATFKHNFTTKDEGIYSIKVTSTDKSGNKAKDQFITFVIDKTAPVLSIENVDHHAYYATSKNVKVSVDEENFNTNNVSFTVKKNGQDITKRVEGSQGNTWRNAKKYATLNYLFKENGEYEITINATDAAQNRANEQKVIFTIDTVDPQIEISGVENNEHYNKDMPVFISVKDVNFKNNIVTVKKDGKSYDMGGFSVEHNQYKDSVATLRHTFKQEGTYEIVVESKDKAGNNAIKSVIFTIDKTSPVITPVMKESNTPLKDGQYINEIFTPQFILDNVEDEIVSVTLNGGSNIVNKIPVASREMVYHFDVLARDKAGNETTLQISFTVDTTKPELNISGIIEGFFNENISPYITYNDKHLDEKNTYVTLNGQPYTNGTVLTEEGDYILKAVITDLANNVSERTIVFTIDKTAPVIKFEEEIADQYFNKTVIPSLFIEDMTDYDIISLTLNGEPYTLGDPIEEEGKHVLHFEVKDKANNIKQLTIEFMIDKTPPNIIVNGIEDNKDYDEAVQLEIKLDNPEDTIKSIKLNGEEVTGLLTEENGMKVLKLDVSKIDSYELVIEAYDEAGNIANSTYLFNIVEKSLLTKFIENKALFIGSIAGSLLLLLLTLLAFLRQKKVVAS